MQTEKFVKSEFLDRSLNSEVLKEKKLVECQKVSSDDLILYLCSCSQMSEINSFFSSSIRSSIEPEVSIRKMHFFSTTVPKVCRLPVHGKDFNLVEPFDHATMNNQGTAG